MKSAIKLLALSALAVLLVATQVSSQATPITFTLIANYTPWSARHDAALKQVDRLEYGNPRTNVTNPFVVFSGRAGTSGDVSFNDVWMSSNLKDWTLAAGVTSNGVRAAYYGGNSSFTATPFMAELQNYINTELYLLGGCYGVNATGAINPNNVRWRSINGGSTWTQVMGGVSFTSRCAANGAISSNGEIFIAGGYLPSGAANDVWISTNRAASFTRQTAAAPWQPRASHMSFIQSSATLGVDVLYVLGGRRVSDNSFYNDVWASSDRGITWRIVNAAPGWSPREAPGVEVTPEGMIVLFGGYGGTGLNDVWVSVNGGLTFGNCQTPGSFGGLWWPSTVLTKEGFLYIVGGTDGSAGLRDVWKSDVNLRFFNTYAEQCGNLQVPVTRGMGLQCWPPNSTNPNSCTPNLYTTAPRSSYTFDNVNKVGLSTNPNRPGWDYGGGAHTGVATFNGNNQFINLLQVTDKNNRLFPFSFGGSMSFEFWATFRSFNRWSRLMEFATDIDEYGNGDDSGNILIGNSGTSNGFALHVYPDLFGSLQKSYVEVVNIFRLNTWVHVVCTFQQREPGITTTWNSAIYTCFINGTQIAGKSGVYPPVTPRIVSWLGKSAWPTDQYFNGLIDSFYFYDYALSVDQIQARFVLPRPPIFDLAFAWDPRPFLGIMGTASYLWKPIASTDFNGTETNVGIIELNGVDNYIDLGTPSGPHSIGTTLPMLPPSQQIPYTLLNEGYSIELLFKTPDEQTWGKVIDWGNGREADNIVFGFIGESRAMAFEVWRGSNSNGNQRMNVITNAVYGTWYHVVITMTPTSGNFAIWTAYVNGDQVAVENSGFYPASLPRRNTYIGKSNWDADQYFNGSIDTVRLYDYALDIKVIQSVYNYVKLPDLFKSGPLNSYRFDSAPNYLPDTSGSFYSWIANSDGRSGIASFDGVSNFVNLLAVPDDNGVFFPRTMGGSLSFEFWSKYSSFGFWSRQIDLGSGPNDNNILIAHAQDTSNLEMHIYLGNQLAGGITIQRLWQLNTWQHVIVSISQRSYWDKNSNEAALYQVFINGNLSGASYGPLPRNEARALPYLGRSHWNADAYFNGQIDSFYWYNYGLNREQARAHYIVARPPVFELSFDFDPRPYLGLTPETAAYSYDSYSADSFNFTESNFGVIKLNGSYGQYINLATSVGPNSVGTTMPTIGGAGSGTAAAGNIGWTFEVLFKSPDEQTYARVYDFGAGPGIDEIALWTQGDTRQIQFSTWNSRTGGTRQILPVISSFERGTWYHVVVVVVPNGAPPYQTTTQTSYVNGVKVANISNGLVIDEVARPNCYLGRSPFNADQYFNGSIDTLRVYDYALDYRSIQRLFVATYTEDITSCTGVIEVPPEQSSTGGGDGNPGTSTGVTDSSSGGSAGATAAIVIVVLVLVALAIGIGYYYYKRTSNGGGGGSSILGGGMSSFFGSSSSPKQNLLETEMENAESNYKPLSFRPGPQM